jgi:hypothetical protein
MHRGGESNKINALRIFVVETLCMFKIWFPPTFFDLMTHLVIHLVDKLEICRLVLARWCYPIERYLNALKKYVCNKAKTQRMHYIHVYVHEALGFCIEYFTWYPHIRYRMWDVEKIEEDVGEGFSWQGKT